ncbi:MAG: hypothetical protein JWP91_3017 [Fibrobacteres bacterium]|nr:hypothetical protein [Fibrobacterota bacterium]
MAIQKIFLPGQSPTGEPIYSLITKRTYDIVPGGKCTRAKEDKKLFPADKHWGDPMNSSVRFETDHIPYKLQTDVAFDGKAYSLGGVPVQNLTCAIVIGKARKEVLVVGDRICRWMDGGRIAATPPALFATMELRSENAYGGVDVWSDPKMPYSYPRNHLGKGFVVKPNPKSLFNLELPNIEDPKDRMTAERLCIMEMKFWEKQPLPAGLGWISKIAPPRSSLAGVMPGDVALEKELREANAALLDAKNRELYMAHPLPRMDFRYFNGAALTLPYMAGDEGIRLENLSPEGVLEFQLPGEVPKVHIDMGLGPQDPQAFLHTVQIRGEDRQVDLVWRACVSYPGMDWLPQMTKLDLTVE